MNQHTHRLAARTALLLSVLMTYSIFASALIQTMGGSYSKVYADSSLQAAEAGSSENDLALWYRQPATAWETQALPIGNGHMGGMVFGGVEQERGRRREADGWLY
ncbi:glycoside hydrolase N-terminal domain-containing protein [Paenibacillus sp. LHD-117]|uniref:glycoside hydrolase N-terminal domain-containing protein n=1 Tax=Paenibacillus sp. LHD-117 TaxID=3071412 RepID=UPI0027DFA345|nr:glycoside hydrolase N-terminal domain-containing protein [Paenibacillus sp. LHD-117]MDQ6422165.1 glycoside hydrolase N-terminal domain-containing protein [Paenibacillus sp. LHD-117]